MTTETTNVICFPKPRMDRPFEESILRVNAYFYYVGLFGEEKAREMTDKFIDFWRLKNVQA
jgi:hypothetical protein